uniref:C2H2-type domain-containing protein n=1 Tax=Glossina pallidipes TaxID=7398 RepID=A0A1B0AHQ1_GLOPL
MCFEINFNLCPPSFPKTVVDRGTDLLEPMKSSPSRINKRTRSSITGNNHHYITLIDGAPPNRSVNSKLYRICVKRNLYPNKIEITTPITTTTRTTTTTTAPSSSSNTHRSSSSSQRTLQNTTKCEKKRYACSRCNKSYTWRCNLYRHLRIECEQQPKFICSQCNAKFYYRAVLGKHMNRKILLQPID